jgi:predicted transcriptional regulator
MTLRLDDDDDRAVAATAAREHLSKHEVIVRAVRAYTGSRQTRLDTAIDHVVTRDRDLLDRLGKA